MPDAAPLQNILSQANGPPAGANTGGDSDALVQQLLQKLGQSSDTLRSNIVPFRKRQQEIEGQISDIQPPPAPTLTPVPTQAPDPQVTDPLKAMSSPMMMMALLGGALTGAPITAALKNGEGFLKGIQAGDQEATKNHLDEFNANLKAANDANSAALEKYRAAFESKKFDMDKLTSELRSIASETGDEMTMHQIETGDIGEAFKLLDARQKNQDRLTQLHNDFQDRIYGTKPMQVMVTGPDGKSSPQTVTYGVGGFFDAATHQPVTGTVGFPSEQYGKNPKGAAFSKWMEEHAADNGGQGPTAAEQEAFIQSSGGAGRGGALQGIYANRIILSGNEAAKDLANVVQLPTTASTGWFGGRTQGPGILDAGREVLTNKMTSQEAQAYNVMSAGFQRSLAAIEAAGLAPRGGLTQQMDAVIFKEGDTNLTKLYKLAQTRQIVEAGLEVIGADPTTKPELKDKISEILGKVRQSVPFTTSDLINLQKAQEANPQTTLKDIMPKVKAPPKAGDVEDGYRFKGGDPSKQENWEKAQ